MQNNVSIAANTSATLADPVQKNTQPQAADGFLSLLEIGIDASRGGKKASSPRAEDAVAAVNEPTSFLTTVRPIKANNNQNDRKSDAISPLETKNADRKNDAVEKNAERDGGPRIEPSKRLQPRIKQSDDNDQAVAARDVKENAPAVDPEENKAAVKSTKTDRVADQAFLEGELEKPSGTLRDQIEQLNKILEALLQALSNGASSAMATVTTTQETTITAEFTTQQTSEFAVFFKAAQPMYAFNAPFISASQTTPEVVSGVQNLLAQLQQQLAALQASGSSQTTNLADLEAFANAFSDEASSFESFLKQVPLNDENRSLLEQVRTQLTAIRDTLVSNNERLQNLIQNFAGTQIAPTQAAQPVLSANVSNTIDNTVSSSVETVTAVQSQEPLIKNAAVTPTTAFSAATQLVSANTATSSNTNQFSGGERQPGAQTLLFTPASAATSQANNNTPTSFAKFLNQPATPIPEQIAVQIKTMPRDGNSKITINLHPAELGKLEIKLDVSSDGKTSVTITADNKTTLAMLQNDSSNLQKTLNDAGLKTDQNNLSFNLRDQGQQAGQGQNQDQPRKQAAEQYLKSQPEEPDLLALAAITRNYVIQPVDGLDITI